MCISDYMCGHRHTERNSHEHVYLRSIRKPTTRRCPTCRRKLTCRYVWRLSSEAYGITATLACICSKKCFDVVKQDLLTTGHTYTFTHEHTSVYADLWYKDDEYIARCMTDFSPMFPKWLSV